MILISAISLGDLTVFLYKITSPIHHAEITKLSLVSFKKTLFNCKQRDRDYQNIMTSSKVPLFSKIITYSLHEILRINRNMIFLLTVTPLVPVSFPASCD